MIQLILSIGISITIVVLFILTICVCTKYHRNNLYDVDDMKSCLLDSCNDEDVLLYSININNKMESEDYETMRINQVN